MFPNLPELQAAEQLLRASRDELQVILQTVADGVMVQDQTGHILYANDAAARLCGYPSAEALLAAPLADVLSRFQLSTETGEPLPHEELPAQRAFRGEQAPAAVLRSWIVATGEESWSTVQARPIRDAQGAIQRVVSAFQDVTALKSAELREHFLNQASALLAESLEYDTTLARVAQLAVPQLADWAAVDILEPDGTIRRLAVAHADPEKVAWARELEQRYPTDPDATSGVPQVIRSGQPEFYPTIPEALLAAAAIDEEFRHLLDQLHLTSAITVPLQARGKVFGAISLVYAESERRYTEADLRLAQDLASRAALAVDNARLYREAQAALHVREEFLASISHDLRSPLTSVRGLTQLSMRRLQRMGTPESERVAAALANVDRATTNMVAMIDELLDLSRLESGRPLDLTQQAMDLVALVYQLTAEQQRGAPTHEIRVEASVPELSGVWDPVRIERVLANLLSNAIKYSPDGGMVRVRIEVERDWTDDHAWATVSVQDHGIGIPAADLPVIFERFQRGSNVPQHIRGAGIGLAGARQIVEQHGGTLSVESQEGQGSRFTVRLPLASDEPEEA